MTGCCVLPFKQVDAILESARAKNEAEVKILADTQAGKLEPKNWLDESLTNLGCDGVQGRRPPPLRRCRRVLWPCQRMALLSPTDSWMLGQLSEVDRTCWRFSPTQVEHASLASRCYVKLSLSDP